MAAYTTVTLLSFAQWLDNWLLQRGQAYRNTSSRFYYQPDPTLTGYVAYASPFKSFVWDSGVSGANVLSSVSGGGGTIGRGTSGMMVDYVNGRVLFNAAVGTNATISGAYAFKDINVYFANQSQERMVFTNKYYLNSRFARSVTGIPPAYDFVTPCVFVSAVTEESEPGCFGGLYNTVTSIALTVLGETQSQTEAIVSLVSDAEQVSFPQLPPAAWPLNSYGDYKGGTGYNYLTTQAQYGQPCNLYTVSDVQGTKVSDASRIDEAVFAAVVELNVTKMQTIH